MISLSERRIEQVVQQAQLSLYIHERDGSYPEILELVDEMVDLLVEVRRDRAALQAIAAQWPAASASAIRQEPGGQLAMGLCATARTALGLTSDAADSRWGLSALDGTRDTAPPTPGVSDATLPLPN